MCLEVFSENVSSDNLNNVLSLWCRESNLQRYWKRKFAALGLEEKGFWLMKLIFIKGPQVLADVTPFCLTLKKWIAMRICESWKDLSWPVFMGHKWYTAPGVLEDKFRVRPPVIINMNLKTNDIQRLVDLCLAAVKEGLHNSDSPVVSRFIHFRDQGLVLRHGYVFERVKGFQGDPYFRATTVPGSVTDMFVNELRAVLPLGNVQLGMLLVRVSNFSEIRETVALNSNVTPWHTDREEYGEHIYATSLVGESGLVWGIPERHDQPPLPYIIVPDLPGVVTYYTGDIVRRPWLHGVPNNRQKRISVTWRPYTRADGLRNRT